MPARFLIFILAFLAPAIACNFPPLAAPTVHPTTSPLPVPTSDLLEILTPPPGSAENPGTGLPPTETAPDPIPTYPYQPAFEPASCAFPVPPGYEPECGYLVVPENRAREDGPVIQLHVAIFRSRSSDPASDPVVHLAGGPGSSSVGLAGYIFQQGLDRILEQRDFVLFDQRGTGYSRPRLDCPEREAITPFLLERGLVGEETGRAIVEAFRSCRERLASEGVDLSAYNSAASAVDLNDLRLALGYEQVNLYAVSYGTRLALTILRDHPEAVRSAVLDSAYPLEVNLYTTLAPNAERAFNVLFDRCASDPACSGAYPDLRNNFYQLVNELNSAPLFIPLTTGGEIHQVRVDGNLLIDVLFVGLYNRNVAATMPQMIYDLYQGRTSLFEERLRLYFDASSALGMQTALQCAEEVSFALPEEAFRAAEGSHPEIAAFFPASVQPLFAVCGEWSPLPADPRENQAVQSPVPALVFAGEYDPITPPDWGRQVAAILTNAYFFEVPGNGHWVTRSSECTRQMALSFWQDPTTSPDSGCLQAVPGLEFTR